MLLGKYDTAEIYRLSCLRLVKDTDRKVLFIVDNLKVHHGKMVTDRL